MRTLITATNGRGDAGVYCGSWNNENEKFVAVLETSIVMFADYTV